jgi:hypothetical protein
VTKWLTNHPGEVLNKVSFAPLLKEVIESSAKLETLANAFRTSGLYLLNSNALDYRKCLGTSASASVSTENSINTEDELGTTMNYSTFTKIIEKEKINKFERVKDFVSGKNEDFFTLFCMWEYFQNCREQNTFFDSTDGKTQNENQSVMSNGNGLYIPTGTHDGGERMTADHDVNLESGTLKVDNRKSLPAEGSCSNLSGRQCVCSRDSPVAIVVSSEYMCEFLVWPDTLKCKCKRWVERQLFAITSGKVKRCLRRSILPRLQKKRKSKNGKGRVKKQNKRRRIKFQNIQLKVNFSKKYMIMLNVIQCATFAREESNGM